MIIVVQMEREGRKKMKEADWRLRRVAGVAEGSCRCTEEE